MVAHVGKARRPGAPAGDLSAGHAGVAGGTAALQDRRGRALRAAGQALRAGGDQRRRILGAAQPATGGRAWRWSSSCRRSRRGCRSASSWRASRRWSKRESNRLMREAGFDPGAASARLILREHIPGEDRDQATSDFVPMSRYFLRRALRSSPASLPSSSPASRRSRSPTRAMASGLSRCAPPRRLGHDAVDDAEGEEILRGQPQRLGGLLHLVGVLPEDRGAALGRDHRIDRVLQHRDAVGRGEGHRAAGAALADDHARRSARRPAGTSRSSGRSPRPGRAPRHPCRDRRRACRPG